MGFIRTVSLIATAIGVGAICLTMPACGRAKKEKVTTSTPVSAVKQVREERPANSASKPPPATPPRVEEIRNAVGRVLEGFVTIDSSRRKYFAAGDFNGDGSEDLAVVVKPVPRFLSKLNNKDLANWMFGEPRQQVLVGRDATVVLPKTADAPINIAAGDVLVCVIHGYGADGWRDVKSRQAYLLKGVAGFPLQTEDRKAFMSEHKGEVPNVTGDVIMDDLLGRRGFLYYNGANYGWLPLPQDKSAAD